MTQRFLSDYKKLLVSGCSFTHNNHTTPCVWANNLAAWAGMSISNLAIPGAGNTHIKNSVILWLEQHKPDPKDVLILVMWSGIERVDWITSQVDSDFKNSYPFTYNYTPDTELVLGGNWWAKFFNPTPVQQSLISYTKFQNNTSLVLNSWLAMTQLTDYLKLRGYTFYYTAWQNLWSPGDQTNQWIDYGVELDRLGLSLDPAPWLFWEHDKYLGTWARDHAVLTEDNLHPTHQGHEDWANAVLIPELLKRNLLNEYPSL